MSRSSLPEPHPAGPSQESVWEYPRPPALVSATRPVRVLLNGTPLASSTQALRVLETSHPPTYYVPPTDVDWQYFTPASGRSFCEWKGTAKYWTVQVEGVEVVGRAWSYERPSDRFESLADHVSFYPRSFECFVGDERVRPQPGEFYGGWVTDEVKGPFKGEPGSMWW
ncbi:MAG: DUF427 domain-containing protein [Acidimicrobiales bacterium]